jgi:hypothetical protein
VTRPTADPLDGTIRLLVDGTNLLHALARGPDPLPAAALIGRLRALVPAGVAVTVVLDGSPAPGGAGRRVAAGVEVRHAGRRSADALLTDLTAARPAGVLVVTDDQALTAALRSLGARTVRSRWLADRLGRQRLVAPAAGRSRPPAPAQPPDETGEDRARWKPGRGATRKTGNPKRGRRSA